ncbi:MAG: efflux RND transporter periplasmic adaptor subunit [Gammaproteobacteria bacterium]|nr:efflux RND transporter periplasmic adaptor subunit [Gammaproteobacteria bacterium]
MLAQLKNTDQKTIATIAVITALLLGWILASSPNKQTTNHENNEYETVVKGPLGGRLLSQEDFSLEITIYETGLPPEFRIYAYDNNKLISPGSLKLNIQLKRLGDKTDHIQFSPQNDFLRGDTTIYEPHSFQVVVNANYKGRPYQWKYDNYEGRTEIPLQIATEMRLKTAPVGPIQLTQTRTLTGRIQANPNRLSRVSPRFTGVVKNVHRELGEQVKKGDILATIESNTSLHGYKLKAPISGVIIKRDIQIGEASGNEPLFVIADLSDVWVELDVFASYLDEIKTGQSVVVETLEGKALQSGKIDWVSPLTSHASQSVRVRATLNNKSGKLRPGQYVRGRVTVIEETIPLAVRQSAIQSFRDFQVVYAKVNDTYEVRMLELGRSNSDWVEVLSGIEPGTEYVTENSYLLKADIEKSGASHDH